MSEWVGISECKLSKLISEVYTSGAIAERKKKSRKWTKDPKIPAVVLEETTSTIKEWNQAGTLVTIPKLVKWMRTEKQLTVTEDQLWYYLRKLRFKWGLVKRKGEWFDSP